VKARSVVLFTMEMGTHTEARDATRTRK
jgi:hypothetical protein